MATALILPAGKVLACQGDVGFEMFILLDGTASVTRMDSALVSTTAGDVVGELAVISVTLATQRWWLKPNWRFWMTDAGLDQLLDDIPGLAKHLLYEVTARLVAATPEDAR